MEVGSKLVQSALSLGKHAVEAVGQSSESKVAKMTNDVFTGSSATAHLDALEAFLKKGRPEMEKPENFQEWVKGIVDRVVPAKGELEALNARLGEAQAAQQKQHELAVPQLAQAKAALQKVHDEFIAPIRQVDSRLANARESMVRAVLPERQEILRQIDESQSELSHLKSEADSIDSTAMFLSDTNYSSSKYTIQSHSNNIESDANDALRSLERAESILKRTPSDSEIDAAARPMGELFAKRDQLKQIYDQQVAAPTAEVNRLQKIYDEAMASFTQATQAAQSAVESGSSRIKAALEELEAMWDVPGMLKRTSWKMFSGFDSREFLSAQKERLK